MAQILVTKPGALNQRDRAALRKAGVVTVEADDPASVRLIQPDGQPLASGDLFLAAMRGIDYTSGAGTAFAKAVLDMAELRWAELDALP